MKLPRTALVLATMTAAICGFSANALAVPALALMPSTVMLASLSVPAGNCGTVLQPALGTPVSYAPGLSKSQAILGGKLSRLELIALQQSGKSTENLVQPAPSPVAATPSAACQQLALPLSSTPRIIPGLRQSPLAPGDFLASKRLPVRRTVFDREWNRVSRQTVSPRLAAALVHALPVGGDTRAAIAAVNSWTNANIRYVEDRAEYGKADYWAGASTTLKRRAGDCEDIAVAKMQLLAALGVARSDMYLTIARDLVRNADHALLVVRQGDRYLLLGNNSDRLLDANQSQDYRPILSFSASTKWLHGY